MKKIVMLLGWALCCALPCSAQYFSVDTLQLNRAYDAWAKRPNSQQTQENYFKAFPSTWQDFIQLYQYCDKSGYDLTMYKKADKQVLALSKLDMIDREDFCRKLLCLAVDARYDCDAPSYLQGVVLDAVNENPILMEKLLKGLGLTEQFQFWQFLFATINCEADGGTANQAENQLAGYNVYKSLQQKFKDYPETLKLMRIAFLIDNNHMP